MSSYHIPNDPRYRCHTVLKSDGHVRVIHEPTPQLKIQQLELLKRMQAVFAPCLRSERVQGGIKGRSCKTNAMRHQGAKYLLTMDISDFYNSIHPSHLATSIQALLDANVISGTTRYIFTPYSYDAAMSLLFMTDENTGEQFLPTGAPTSPIVANIACWCMDNAIEAAIGEKCLYSRYFDDIAISVWDNKRNWNLQFTIANIAWMNGAFRINDKKTKWMTRGSDNMMVTGVTTSNYGSLRIPRKIYRKTRSALYQLAKEHKDIPEDLRGMLSYISSINKKQVNKLIQHYEQIKRN